eukprot:5142489-Amphidinium_carterae.1
MASGSHGMKRLFVPSGILPRCCVPKLLAPDLTLRAWLSASLPLPIGNSSSMGRAKKRIEKRL